MQGTRVRFLVQEDPTCHRATKPAHHTYCASALQQDKESWGCSSAQVPGPNNRGANSVSPGQIQRPENQECRCLRTGENGCPTSGGRSKSPLPLPFCAIHALDGLENSRSHQWGWIFFNHLINSNANLFQKHPHSRSEIMFYQLSGHPFAQ